MYTSSFIVARWLVHNASPLCRCVDAMASLPSDACFDSVFNQSAAAVGASEGAGACRHVSPCRPRWPRSHAPSAFPSFCAPPSSGQLLQSRDAILTACVPPLCCSELRATGGQGPSPTSFPAVRQYVQGAMQRAVATGNAQGVAWVSGRS